MRYAVVFNPDLNPYLDGRAIAKIEGSVATYYIDDTSLEDNEIRRARVLYTESGVYLLTTENKFRTSTGGYYYELLIPETHQYFNFGLLTLKQGDIGFGVGAQLDEAISVMRSKLNDLFNRMMTEYEKRGSTP